MIILILGRADKQKQKQNKSWILPFYFCFAKVYEYMSYVHVFVYMVFVVYDFNS